MARIRTIKPEFWTDSRIVQLPFEARLLFIGLWNFSDDYGAVEYERMRLQLQIFPANPEVDIELMVDFLVAANLVDLLIGEDKDVLLIKNWSKHQKVDNPSKTRIDTTQYRKLAIPSEARRAVAKKYGCPPGESVEAACYFCGAPGKIYWNRMPNGRVSTWVTFSALELDHFEPERDGGEGTGINLVLSCRTCNRGRCDRDPIDWFSRILANPRESSLALVAEGKGREGKGEGKDNPPLTPPRMTIREFEGCYCQTFGVVNMPAGIRPKAEQMVGRYPRDRLIDAFASSASNGARYFDYMVKILENPRSAADDYDPEALAREIEEEIANGTLGRNQFS